LVADEARLDQIVGDVLVASEARANILVLTTWVSHLNAITERLQSAGKAVTVLSGGMKARERRQITEQLATRAWNERHRYVAHLTSLEAALARAKTTSQTLILADVADNPGGGGRGNTAWLLQALHEAAIPSVVLGLFVDPALAAEAHALGEGAVFEARFNRDPSEFSLPFSARARVTMLTDGKGQGRRGNMAGRQFNLGPTARLTLEGSGLEVVVISLRRQCHEPRTLEMHGINIAAARVVMPRSVVRLSAGRVSFSAADQALCFLAGANSVFSGDTLLTTPNNEASEDARMFAELGLTGRPAFVPYAAGGPSSAGPQASMSAAAA
jgi:microcystin degradation protein MlrC